MITGIAETIDYVRLAGIVREKMNSPHDLLETIAMRIAEQVHSDFPQVKHIEISIEKLHPPIEQFTGQTGVTYSRDY
jgi:dihydroneopterin aldolase